MQHVFIFNVILYVFLTTKSPNSPLKLYSLHINIHHSETESVTTWRANKLHLHQQDAEKCLHNVFVVSVGSSLFICTTTPHESSNIRPYFSPKASNPRTAKFQSDQMSWSSWKIPISLRGALKAATQLRVWQRHKFKGCSHVHTVRHERFAKNGGIHPVRSNEWLL